jgi:hypothetical protein
MRWGISKNTTHSLKNVNYFSKYVNKSILHTSGILITVSNRILIGGGGARFVVASTEDLEESSIVSSRLVKPFVTLFEKIKILFS